jgi:biopolymer transport protein TolR
VFLRCDEKVPFGIFASVIDALRQSGINNISIVTEPLTDRSRK